ncbi:restriction endonuclease subunit S (plasmid) [Pseudoalteromonas lipolytica]|uniref:Restriction endonuclease subunit S n=1 Tax=Pseudoalteromonas lipolytica TaxID=570156 RepID=A0AAD0S4D5_9GAMM|nr:restriction endonuclease subunit S [Pseudoalteromonas donghaensis]AXV67602.1 restriction endonuclease subunit S [Pseudoalteromonas donghaensis]
MVSSHLPWLEVKLGEVVPYGKTEKCKLSDVTGDTWILELEDIEKDSSKIIQRLDVNARPFKSTKNKFSKGDVLYGKLRPYLNKVVIADKPGVCSTEIIPLNAGSYIHNRYLFYWLKTKTFLDFVNSVSYGVNMPRLGTKDGLVAPFVLAPLAEQKVIADKIDTLLSQVEATKARLERIPKILKTFRQSVLVAAVSGKLTEKWRNNNRCTPVHETIANIETARQLVIKGKDKKAKSHLKEEEYVIPNTWQWVSLDSLSKKITDGAHHTPTYTESGIHFISVKDIRDGAIDFSDTKFISEKEHLKLSKRCPVEVGDLLVTKSGTIGRTAIVKANIEFSLFVSVALIKPASIEVNTKFIDISLQKWVNEIDVSSRIVGSAIKNLHLRDIKELAIPFAPKEEQAVIVHRVEELFDFAKNIEQKTNAALERVKNLRQSVLAKAFRGELTADWRAANPDLISGDNSAEALLEKIKAEREVTKKPPKPKHTAVKKKTGSRMSKKIIEAVEALKEAKKPLNGQELLAASGYPSDSSTEQLEQFFLDIRKALTVDKSIIKLERTHDGQDWFALAESATKE